MGKGIFIQFSKRERSEGSANNHALVFYYHQDLDLAEEQLRIQSIFSLGHQWKPSVLDPVQSKYAVPDYTQINWDLFFPFQKIKESEAGTAAGYQTGQRRYSRKSEFLLQ